MYIYKIWERFWKKQHLKLLKLVLCFQFQLITIYYTLIRIPCVVDFYRLYLTVFIFM